LAEPTRRVLLHVGTPKTGTSYLQDVLFHNRDRLARHGVLYPADRFDAHFLAALDLMDMEWGGLERQAVGAWDRLAEQVRGWRGTVIVSHEILATASRQQVARALASFIDPADPDGTEVHVVLSARDLVRQVPAEWQENVKHRRTIGYRAYLDTIVDPAREGLLASWFWGVQEVPDILDRWADTLPPAHVHLVTVPRPGAPRDLLWQRFSGVLGLDGLDLEHETERTNASMGVPETALVRRVNEQVNKGVLANEDYRRFVRELMAHQTLSLRTGSHRLALPADVHRWAVELEDRWIEALAPRGYDVVGSLDDLRADPEPAPFADPDAPDEVEVTDAAIASVVSLLTEAARLRQREDYLARELDAAYVELEGARGLWFRAKRRLVRLADDHRAAALSLAVYRRLRGRA